MPDRTLPEPVFLGIDTGGTYTDAVIVNAAQSRVLGKAKSLTTRPDLAPGIAASIDAALASAGVDAGDVALVSISTTLATNALVEGRGGHVALVAIGFGADDLNRAGLQDALQGDPVIRLNGGHDASGNAVAALDAGALDAALASLPRGTEGVAVAASFAVRNPEHELAARARIRAVTGLPVTCSHELSARLGGPRRALTAVLNARLVGMITRLIAACEAHLETRGIVAPVMVVRGDGALISAAQARERPIETILSGPAASIVGARWLTGEQEALVSDIGGTTTDIALLRGGLPAIDPEGARVGSYRTMVEAVAMRTTGLGGDSEVHPLVDGLETGLRLGPRRLVPVSLLAFDYPAAVHAALDNALRRTTPMAYDARFVLRLSGEAPDIAEREAALLARVGPVPVAVGDLVQNRRDLAALDRLVALGHVMLAGPTPSDAAHVLGRSTVWDNAAADKALRLMARLRTVTGTHLAPDTKALALAIVDQLTAQTSSALLEAALAEDPVFAGLSPVELARHPLLRAALAGHDGTLRLSGGLGVPVIGLGASAHSYYGAVGTALNARMILPEDGGVANAIGAVVGQIAMRRTGLVTSPGEGRYIAHLADGKAICSDPEEALAMLEKTLRMSAFDAARAAGAEEVVVTATRTRRTAEIEGRTMFIEGEVTASATGRPRIARLD